MTNTTIPWDRIRCLSSARLIALDKCPGIRPIGIGESLRRLCGKVVMDVTGNDVKEACGSDQLCAGLEGGVEGAVHAMILKYEEIRGKGGAVLLVDADNAFNNLNRRAALIQARYRWPRASKFLFNTYRAWAPLIQQGTDKPLFSKEGTTQGDPLSSSFYAIGVLPLVERLKAINERLQVWYADDASCVAQLEDVRKWFDQLQLYGPAYGYFPAPTKSYLVVEECDILRANELFSDLGVQIVSHHRLLGSVIGTTEGRKNYVDMEVNRWGGAIKKLSTIAAKQPQNVYSAITKSLQCEWGFMQRVIPDCDSRFSPLEEIITNTLMPSIMGGPITINERKLAALPVRIAGLGLPNPVTTAASSYVTSIQATSHLTGAILGNHPFSQVEHQNNLRSARNNARKNKEHQDEIIFQSLLPQLNDNLRRAVERAKEGKTGGWLTVMPTEKDGHCLSAQEFQDGLSVRYARIPHKIPTMCDGCGVKFDLDHALICKRGGLIIQRHNEVRDELAHLSALAYGERNVSKEPRIREGELMSGGGDNVNIGIENGLTERRILNGLVADLKIRGVFERQTDALFDIRVKYTDAPSYLKKPVKKVLEDDENDKKKLYHKACTERRMHFVPFVCSVDGVYAREAKMFLKRLGGALSEKWKKSYGQTMGFVKARMGLAIMRATNLCIRGVRKSVYDTRAHMEGGAGMGLSM